MKRTIILFATLALLASAVHAGDEPAGSTDRATTVKSSKSNSSERASAGPPTPRPAASDERGTTVKGSKSNSSE